MNILKTFRKPHFAVSLSLLVLSLSCSDSNKFNDKKQLSIEEYVEEHISLTNELLMFLNMESEISYKKIEKFPTSFDNIKEFELHLEDANFENSSKISVLFNKIQNNTKNFIHNSGVSNQENITDKITSEINHQINNNAKIYNLRSENGCRDEWEVANDRCNTTFYIAAATSAVVGAFTLGAAIGAGVAILNLAICKNNADDDYNECMGYS